MTRHDDVRHVARSGVVQALTAVAQSLGPVSQAVFARLYGKDAYGAFTSVLFTIEILCRGGAAGADKAMLRYVAAGRAAKDPEAVRSALGTGLRLHWILAGLFSLLLPVGAPFLGKVPFLGLLLGKPQFTSAWILAPLPILMGSLWILMQATLAARVTSVNFWTRGLAEPGLLLAAGLIAWWIGGGFRALAGAYVSSYTLTLGLAVLLARRVFAPAERHHLLTAPHLRGFARFSLPQAGGEFLNALVQRADVLMLSALQGDDSTAFYNVANVVTAQIANIRYVFDSVLTGLLSEARHLSDHERLVYNYRLVLRWVLSAAAPVTIALLALRGDLLPLIFGREYAPGIVAVVALGLSHFLNATLGLSGWVLLVAGRTRLGLLNNVIAAAFNLPVGYLLIRSYGLWGASLTALMTTVLLQGLMAGQVWMLERVSPFSRALLKPLAAAAITSVVDWGLVSLLPSALLRLFAVVGLGTATYVGVLLGLGLPREERQTLALMLRRRRAAASED